MLVACTGSKGGCGASTLAATVAAGLLERGVARHRVLLIDAGPEATLTHWAQIAHERGVPLPPVARWQPGLDVEALARGFEHVILDGAAPWGPEGLVPDLWLVPVRPVGPDTWSVGRLRSAAWAQRCDRLRIVPWRVPARCDLRPWRRALEAEGFAVAPVLARDRLAYAHALAEGRLPARAGDLAARAEAAALGGYVLAWGAVGHPAGAVATPSTPPPERPLH